MLFFNFILFWSFLDLTIGHSFNEFHSQVPIQIDLIDTGYEPDGCYSKNNCSSVKISFYILRFYGSHDLISLFPFLSEPNLTVKLYPALNRLTDQLNVYVTDNNGSLDRVEVIEQSSRFSFGYFRGQLIENVDSSSEVFAIGKIDQQTDTILLQAFIRFGNLILYLRPRSNFPIELISSHSNLYIISNESDSFYQLFKRQFAHNLRLRKRSSYVENSCPMIIYVDYSLFTKLNMDRGKTILFVNFAFNFANEIFLGTKFTFTGFPPGKGENYEDYGHTLCQVVIQEQPPRPGHEFYNENRDYWPGNYLQRVLYNLKDRESHCLAYLFTNLKINDTIYGDVNGYAMTSTIFSKNEEHPNSGVVSFEACDDPWNWYCVLNFVHELGHNWGSPHDPDSEDCISSTNGSYIMRMPYLDIYGSNNLLFSACSIRAIYHNIQSISYMEFKSFCAKCGNGIVEPPEECDEGNYAGHCCSRDCKLLTEPNAKCSHFNHDCCDDKCQVRSLGFLCRNSDPLFCWKENRCDGQRLTCPKPTKMADGSRCSYGGVCLSGYCNISCPAETHVECKCSSLLDQCYSCCQEGVFVRDYDGDLVSGVQGKCARFAPLRDGTTCQFNRDTFGKCQAGHCVSFDIIVVDDRTEPPTPKNYFLQIFVGMLLSLCLIFVGYAFLAKYLTRYLQNKIEERSSNQSTNQLKVHSPLLSNGASTSRYNSNHSNGTQNGV